MNIYIELEFEGCGASSLGDMTFFPSFFQFVLYVFLVTGTLDDGMPYHVATIATASY